MGLFIERGGKLLYPSAITELQKPVDGTFNVTWAECVAHCLGADASGYAGCVVNGKLITNGAVAALNTWATAI